MSESNRTEKEPARAVRLEDFMSRIKSSVSSERKHIVKHCDIVSMEEFDEELGKQINSDLAGSADHY